jgi:hypothetical protein
MMLVSASKGATTAGSPSSRSGKQAKGGLGEMVAEPRAPGWRPANPKLTSARTNWYRYYAGYSTQFVRDVLDHLELTNGATVLDPWNGSGTTTATASESGFGVIGYDANPALVIVALARQLDLGIKKSLNALTTDLLKHAREEASDTSTEPLATWFGVETASRLRGLERAIQRTQVDDGEVLSIADTGVERISTLAAFFYVALFEVTRSLVSPFRTSNPTWVKTGAAEDELVSRSWDQLEAGFRQAVAHLTPTRQVANTNLVQTLEVGNSTDLPGEPESVDATVTSPPYCTRIDYVKATLPELAVLGYDVDKLAALRNSMVGTPTMWREAPLADKEWGKQVNQLLKRIGDHPSKASAGYYLKYFTQYFDSMWRSITEISRLSRASAPTVLVLQDSYYKEIHVDLAAILVEMMGKQGWHNIEEVQFPLPVTKAAIHPGARAYRKSFAATETVVIARR